MNLTKLFETQAKLDEHIIQEHPELRGQNNLDWKLLALQVELGECANEWRGFKKWSKDQEPRTVIYEDCKSCDAEGSISYRGNGSEWLPCNDCEGSGAILAGNPLLEEYVDCLHFILSIGIEKGWSYEKVPVPIIDESITIQFNELYLTINYFYVNQVMSMYERLLSIYLSLGFSLGFTWEQVEDAYYAKNKVNHERQNAGY